MKFIATALAASVVFAQESTTTTTAAPADSDADRDLLRVYAEADCADDTPVEVVLSVAANADQSLFITEVTTAAPVEGETDVEAPAVANPIESVCVPGKKYPAVNQVKLMDGGDMEEEAFSVDIAITSYADLDATACQALPTNKGINTYIKGGKYYSDALCAEGLGSETPIVKECTATTTAAPPPAVDCEQAVNHVVANWEACPTKQTEICTAAKTAADGSDLTELKAAEAAGYCQTEVTTYCDAQGSGPVADLCADCSGVADGSVKTNIDEPECADEKATWCAAGGSGQPECAARRLQAAPSACTDGDSAEVAAELALPACADGVEGGCKDAAGATKVASSKCHQLHSLNHAECSEIAHADGKYYEIELELSNSAAVGVFAAVAAAAAALRM